MTFSNETEKLKAQIQELQEKLQKLEEIEKQPQMNLQQESDYAVVLYHNKIYYRLQGIATFSWYIKKGVSANHPVPTLMMVNDAETERLLEGIYYNHIQVKKEKEQRTKTSVEEAYKDWRGEYPETGTTASNTDDARWLGFQAGYEFAYAISTAKEVMEEVQEEPKDNEWKSVALRFGEKLVSVGPCGYYDFTPEEWLKWALNAYEKLADDWLSLLKKETAQERGERIHKDVERCVRESVKWCEEHPDTDPLDCLKPQTPEQEPEMLLMRQGKVDIVDYNYRTHYRIEYTDSFSGVYKWFVRKLGEIPFLEEIRDVNVYAPLEELYQKEVVKQKDDYPYKKYTPEETEQSLKKAFSEAQKTEKWKEIQNLIDEEDNDKNFKNSLDLIKEWGEKNKPRTLKELLWEWWEDIFTVVSDLDADASIDDLVDRIQLWLPKEQSAKGSQNAYVECSVDGFNDCLNKIKGNLR